MNDFKTRMCEDNFAPRGCDSKLMWAFDDKTRRWITFSCTCETSARCTAHACEIFVNKITPKVLRPQRADELSLVPNRLLTNVVHNQHYYSEKGLNLTIAGGLLGFQIIEDSIVLVCGGQLFWDFDDCMRKMMNGECLRAHLWLEDAEGNVYDHVSTTALASARFAGVTTKIRPLQLIEGLSKDEIFRTYGIWYRSIDPIVEGVNRYLKKKWQRAVAAKLCEMVRGLEIES